MTLPPPKPPVANYVGTKRSGDLLFVSGRVSGLRGEVGSEIDTTQAKRAARDAMLDLLAIIKQDIGDLDRIASVERLHGFVRSATTFTAQPEVIDGASDLLVELVPGGTACPDRDRGQPAAPRRRGPTGFGSPTRLTLVRGRATSWIVPA